MKKILSIVLALMLVSVAAVAEGEITVLTREDGSGTLSAFTELFGIEEDGSRGHHHQFHRRYDDHRAGQPRRDRLHLPGFPE